MQLYQNRGTWLNRLHPCTMAVYALTAILLPLLVGKRWLFVVTILCSLALLWSGKVFFRALPLFGFSITLVVVIFIIQGMFYKQNQTQVFHIFMAKFFREGLLYALSLGLNLFNMLFAFAVFVLTTSIDEFVEELEQMGMPTKMGYMIIAVFQIVPQMLGTKDAIIDAQRSRGMEVDGNLWLRIRATLPLVSPVVISALNASRERAMALEVRGFGRKTKKTYLDKKEKTNTDRVILWMCGLILLIAFLWRLVKWGSFLLGI